MRQKFHVRAELRILIFAQTRMKFQPIIAAVAIHAAIIGPMVASYHLHPPSNHDQEQPIPVFFETVEEALPPLSDEQRSARRRGYEGCVTVEILVEEDGHVSEAGIVSSSGHAELDSAALGVVRTARFAPATENGVAARGRLRLPFNFKLE